MTHLILLVRRKASINCPFSTGLIRCLCHRFFRLLHGLNVKAGRFRESAGPGQGLCRAFGKCGEKRFVAIGFRHLLEQCFHSFQATLLVKSRKHTAHGHHGPVR